MQKIIELTDEDGYKRRYLVNEDDKDNAAEVGLDVGVPDLNQLDWEGIKRDLHNQLFDKRLFTIEDVRRQELGITTALRSVFLRNITNLYKE